MTRVLTALVILITIGIPMLLELRLSTRNERRLRARGAVEPVDDVYPWMRIGYPAAFIAMACESLVRATPFGATALAGAAVFVAAKSVKYWAIAALGERWSFRVLVVPGAPLVTSGPYRFLNHPNYVGVIGELVGSALMLQAPVTGMAATLGFAALLRRRIRAEERALGRSTRS